jgi:hypothetical protein
MPWIVATAYIACHYFSGRGAYLQLGAMFGMVGWGAAKIIRRAKWHRRLACENSELLRTGGTPVPLFENSLAHPILFAIQNILREPIAFAIGVGVEIAEKMSDAQAGGVAEIIREFANLGGFAHVSHQ